MIAWSIDLRPLPEPRLVGGRSAGVGAVVFFACYGLVVSVGSILFR